MAATVKTQGKQETRRCPKCKKRRPIEQFQRNKAMKTGYSRMCKTCDNERAKILRATARYEVLSHYSGGGAPKCACCGETKLEFLAIDHINGGGGKHLKEIKRTVGGWLRQQGYPEGFRVLCHNCNFSRGAYGYCPHESTESLEDYVLSVRNPKSRPGSKNGISRLTERQVGEVLQRLALGESMKSLAQRFHVDPTVINGIKLRRAWRHVNAYTQPMLPTWAGNPEFMPTNRKAVRPVAIEIIDTDGVTRRLRP